MKTYVIGDIHGAGDELERLLETIAPLVTDRVISIGDVFDRGLRADLVWRLIQKYNIEVFMGNHEYKILQWLRGEFDWLPSWYYVAMNLLVESGVTPLELMEWLEARPQLRVEGNVILTHAGVILDAPEVLNTSMNIYYSPGRNLFAADAGFVYESGKRQVFSRPEFQQVKAHDEPYCWWDIYQGEQLVVYGHLVTGDNLPRIRRNEKTGRINSIGLDTAACHGGCLTAYCIEDEGFWAYQSGIDQSALCLAQIKEKGVVVDATLVEFVTSQRAARKARLEAAKLAVTPTLLSGT